VADKDRLVYPGWTFGALWGEPLVLGWHNLYAESLEPIWWNYIVIPWQESQQPAMPVGVSPLGGQAK
jgi:hypothetical protein